MPCSDWTASAACIYVYVLLIIFIIPCNGTVTYGVHKPCMGRDYQRGSQVCVCNSTYCDSIEPWFSMNDSHGIFFRYSSSKAGLRLERTIGKFQTNDTLVDDDDVESFLIHPDKKFQSIIGFGAAFTDAAGYNIVNLSEGSRENLLRSYYSVDGIELNMGRVPIGCTQFSIRGYSYAEIPGDLCLKHFSLQPEDYLLKLPLIRKVFEMTNGKLKLIGTPWTAPSWMKTNKNLTGYSMLQLEYYQVWADYFIRFLKEYHDEGVDFWGISTQNRPSKGFVESGENSPCMGWTSRTMSQFIGKFLGPTLQESPYNRIMLITVDDYRYFIPWSLYAMFKVSGTNNDSKKYVNGVGVQWYMDTLVPTENLDLYHDLYPDLFSIMTEAATGYSQGVLGIKDNWNHKVLLGSWERAEEYIENIIENLNHWVSGWLDWNLTLDIDGGPSWNSKFTADATVVTNLTADEFYKQPQFYALGHFSKFLPEGSTRVFVNTGTQSILHAAFITPDDSTVVILYNPHDDPISVEIKSLTSEKRIAFEMPERSIHTVKFWY